MTQESQTPNTQDTINADQGNNKELHKKVIGNYIATLVAHQIYKVSTLNLQDAGSVAFYSKFSVQNKQAVADTSYAFNKIFSKLTSAIKVHLNMVEADYNTDSQDTALMFQNPSLYLTQLDTGETTMITPTDKGIAFAFLLFRAISGKDAYKLEPSYVISFNKNNKETYKNADVLNSFKYKKSNDAIEPYSKGGNGKYTANSEAVTIFREEKDEVASIIKNIFSSYAHDCNKIKDAASDLVVKTEVCRNIEDPLNPDYFPTMALCFEIFQLSTIAGFCEQPSYDDVEL